LEFSANKRKGIEFIGYGFIADKLLKGGKELPRAVVKSISTSKKGGNKKGEGIIPFTLL
jgi:hypothetical protein